MSKPKTKAELQIELEEAKKRAVELEGVIESLDVSLCRWLPDTTLTHANEKYKKIFGITGNVEGKQWLNFIPEEDRASTAAFYKEVTKNPHVVTYEHPVAVEDGSIRHYQWFDTPLMDANGTVTEFQSIGIDITERKLSENELIAKEKKLKSLIDSQSHFVIRVNMAGKYSYWNVQFEKEFGWLFGPQGIQNSDAMIAICEYHHQRVQEVVKKCVMQPGVVFSVEIDKPARDGGVRNTLWEFVCLTDEQNQPVEIQCMGIELTGRRQSERLIAAQRDLARLAALDKPEEEVWAACFQAATLVSELDCGGLYLFNKNTRAFELVYHTGLGTEFVNAVASFGEDTPNAQLILKAENLYFTESELPIQDYHRNEGLRSLAVIPILHRGQILGCVNIASHAYNQIPDQIREALETVATEIGNVIAHQKTEAELEISHVQLRQTLVVARMGAWRYDIFTNRMHWSPEAAQLLGTEHQEEDVDKLLQYFYPADREKMLQVLQNALIQKKTWNFEYRILNALGEMMWVTNFGKVECDKEGNPIAISGLIQDITDRKRAEEARRESDERYHLLFQNMVQGVVFQDKDGHIIHANPAAERILGLSIDQMLGRASIDPRWHAIHEDGSAFPGEDHPAMLALRTGQPVHDVVMGVFNPENNTYRWINVNATPRFFNGSEVPYQVFATFEDITERIEAEGRLQRNEQLLRLFVEHSPAAIAMFDRDMRYIVASKRYMLDYRLKEQNLTGCSHYEVFPEMTDEHNAIHRRCLAGEVVRNAEDPLPRTDGTLDWVRYELRPWYESTGEVGGLIFFSEVITERKQAEDNLRESEKKYRDLINGMNDTAWVIDLDARLLDVNDAAVQALGYSREELLSMKASDIDSTILPGQIQNLINSLTNEKRQVFETHHRRKDGSEIPVEISSSLVSYMGNTVVMSIARDVTERKQAEETLRVTELRNQALIENAPDGIALFNENGRFTFASHSAYRMTGYTPEEIIGQKAHKLIHPEDKERMTTAFINLLHQSSQPVVLQYRFKHKEGHYCWIEGTFNNLIADPAIHAVVENFSDITERKQAEEALNKSQALLKEAQRIGRIGHMEWSGRDQVLLCSDEVYDIFEMPYGTVISQDMIAQKMTPGERERLQQLDMLAIQQRRDMDYEFSIRADNGDIRWLHQVGKMSYDENGIPTRMMAVIQDITDRKRNEEVLRESRTRLEMALKGAKAGMWDWNVQTGELIISTRWAEIVGYSPNELEPVSIKTWRDLSQLDDLRQAEAMLEKHFAGETEFYECEVRMKHKNGSWVWVITQGKVMEWDEDGKPVRMFGTHLDITKQKHEELYTQAILRLTNLSYATSDMVSLMRAMLDEAEALTDSTISFFHFVDDDQNAIKLQAWSTNTLMNLCTAEGQGQHYPVEQAGVWADAIRSGEARIYNDYPSLGHRKGLPAGHAPITRLVTLPIKRNDRVTAALGIGNKEQEYTEQDLDVLQRLVETVFDIIMRKRVEEALLKNEERLRTVADFTYDMEFWMDEDHSLQYMSPSCERITGYKREQFLKDPALLQEIVHPEDRSAFHQHSMEEFEQPNSCSLDFRILTVDGEVRWINHTCQSVTGADGKFRGRRVSHRDITERRRALQELRASEEKYRGLVKSLTNAISVLDINGNFLYLNDTAAADFGSTPQEVVGRNMRELFPEPFASAQMDYVQRVFEIDQEIVYEAQSMVRSGLRWFRVSFQPLHDEGGAVNQILVNATDIHDLKAAQQELQELNHTLEEKVAQRTAEVQDLYENAPTGYHSIDAEGRFVRVNQTQLNWLGYTHEEMIGHAVIDFVTESTRGVFYENFPLLVQRGWVKDIEFEFTCKDGSALPILLNATAIYDEFGNFVMSRSTSFDNTERKQAENELKRNVNFTSALLNAVPTPVFYKDKDGRYLGCNSSFVEFTGKTAEEITGKLPQETWGTSQADMYRHKDVELMQGKDRQVYESVVTDKNGIVCPVIFVKDLFYDESGNVAGLVGAFVDITERKASEESLRESRDELRTANAALQKASQAKNEFLANMSHELRTPLNGILGMSEVLMEEIRGPLNERQRTMVGVIESSGRHLLSLINDILDLSKIEAGKLELRFEEVSVMDVCQTSLTFIKEPATKKGIQVALELDSRAVTIRADMRRMKQILINLLSNAVKFTQPKGKVTLRVVGDEEREAVHFSVIDTGIGISDEDMRKLFTPFTQVDSSLTREHEGTGLGLALVMELVELHGGSVKVESTLGQGSTFTVSIPVQTISEKDATDLETDRTIPSSSMLPSKPSQSQTRGKILIAEDIETNIMIINDYLESLGYTTVTAANGQEAIERAQEHDPDLILMDIQMPVMDGLDATHRLRKNPRFASVPIIALTALAMAGDRERCLEAGATEYISKPVKLKQLAEMIEHFLHDRKK